MDILKFILLIILISIGMRACTLAVADKDKAEWNKCRDAGGSTQYCFSGLK